MKKLSIFYYILSFILLLIFVFLIISAYSGLSAAVNNTAVHTNLPTIVIDAGHGGEDGGAVANGLVEKDVNLSIAKKLADVFTCNGFQVKMIREDDQSIESGGATMRERKVSDMKNRLEQFNADTNNIVISIHQNKFTQSQYKGTQIFYSDNNALSASLAECIKTNVVNLLQNDNTRECKKATEDIYLLCHAEVPAVIVECGFLSNAEEAAQLKDDAYQSQMAFSIYCGFLEFINTSS